MERCPKCRWLLPWLIMHTSTDEKAKLSLKEGHRLIEDQVRQVDLKFECPHCDFVVAHDADEAIKILQGAQ